MIVNLNPPRYAHCEGHTGVCFSEDARHIITCGGEGDIRIWTGIDDDGATDKCVGEKAFAVCQRGEKLYVATNENSVQALTFPDVELDGVVARFTAPVTDIDASKDGTIVVSSSCDMTIGITNVTESTTDIVRGHRAPVLSVALDPKLEFLASSSCDGTVKVWRVSDQKEVMSWDCVPKSNSWAYATALGHPSWQPSQGSLLAVPDRNQVNVYQRDTWEKTCSLSPPNSGNQLLSVVKFSSCGQYLAASSTEGHVHIWNVMSHNLVATLQTDDKHHICSLEWSPEPGQIAFCDNNGSFGTIDLKFSKAVSLKPEDVPMADPTFGDTDDEEDENAISLEKIKNESGFIADGLRDDDDKFSIKGTDDGRSSRSSDVRPQVVVPQMELQPPFQPSSTPVSLQYRYMVWNDVGIVKQTNIEDENAIDVEFHDTNHHHSFRVNNLMGHTMAALSKEVLVLACEAIDDNPSKMVCVMLNAWDGSKEWTTVLPTGEEAICVAAGKGFIAVATDTRMLRVFTTCGTQREVMSLPGPVVCLTAYQHNLAVVFHSATGLDGDQCLSYMQISLRSYDAFVRPCAPRIMPLSPRARLRWLGYTDEGSLCSLDMTGMLRKLTQSSIWTPICEVDDQCKGKSNHHFVVGISETFQTIRSILCKGAYYPPTMPRPTVTEISWKVPLCEPTVEKGELEEQFWRSNAALPALSESDRDNADRTIKKALLKLFALACQSGLEMRAVGLCQLMSPEVIQLAIKYASKLGRMQLANRISDLATQQQASPPHNSMEEEEDSAWKSHEHQPQHYQMSQDLFATEEEDPSSGQENPILALKQRQSGLSSKDMMSLNRKPSNPFRKAGDKDLKDNKGLEGLTKAAMEKPAPRAPTTMSNPFKKSTPNENKLKKNAFVDWFASQKESLEEEFPELDTSELTKVALKRFKEEQKPKPNNGPSVKKFFGSSASNQVNKKQSETASDTDSDSKKRKACDEEISEKPEAKKSSASSKLKMFSFVKP